MRIHPKIQRNGAAPVEKGFTLVELLVVVAIVGVLMGILVGALSQARESARAVVCLSNLRQMQTGWQMFIQQSDGKIPDTRYSKTGFDWRKALNTVYDQAPNIFANGGKSYSACPSLQAAYKNISYADGRWGYAINTWWDSSLPDPDCYNDQKPWGAIVRPSNYPWFIDPQIYDITGGGHAASVRVPYNPLGAPDWGIGANHNGDATANASFADGSARTIPMTEIHNNLVGPNFAWLENR